MNPCQRTAPPPLLAKYAAEITDDYIRRKENDASYKFRWPEREGKSLYEETRKAAREMTHEHCAYCDSFPVDATGVPALDHFRPKSIPRFYNLAYAWENLFYSCTACNHSKLEKWDEALLKPDASDYLFEDYFDYRADTGEIHPLPSATEEKKKRAETTIRILGLNRSGLCRSRRIIAERIRTAPADELSDLPFCFLIPICRES